MGSAGGLTMSWWGDTAIDDEPSPSTGKLLVVLLELSMQAFCCPPYGTAKCAGE